ncbi:HAD-superfamily hydrolase, subfamily IA, variant 1 [Stanieria cyanosphaera PCC 7437]|uniref:HAD-superfamily hydrolase, subfamily IA, variant 1 n=1 Tax=Stanieria cyanosphaera (strain ATCC 29371 / PCC 7437) TaxID=111780 RepID=K9XZM0_STAC7|nr:HAD-IA family hydrolase [Stanieria cyanosphaera]AFZ37102.1 HAD-superfamily hydrolase, subfamily IA, variant 1 [Stanieria cyanosphaera PCC 7437]
MNGKLVFFDFDGTIADSYQAIVKISNQLASEFGYKPVDEEEISLLKNLSSREIIQQSEISIFKIPFLIKRLQRELKKEISNLEPIHGIDLVLRQLKQHDYKLGIITSNAKENVVAFLEKHQLDNIFDFIYSGTTIFGKHRIINNIIKQYQIEPNQFIYVGDETRDIRAAKRSKVIAIAVTWGFNSAEILAHYQPDFLVTTPVELLSAIIESEHTWQKENSEKQLC